MARTSARSARAKFLKLARDRFKQADEADKAQRKRETDDIAFYAGEQWPDDIKSARAGMTLGSGDNSIPVPPRPCITIVGKVRKPVKQVLNQERGSDMGIEIVPADDFGDLSEPISDTEIELREGLIRRIQRDSKAADARTWAFSRATIAGRGYYMVMTRYAPGKTRDQEIYVHRIFDQRGVIGDPAREQPDGSDAEFWFIGTLVPWNRYVAEYPKRAGDEDNPVCGYSDDEWRTMSEDQPDWFIGEGDTRHVRVVDYFYTDRAAREVVTYAAPDGQEVTEYLDELPEAPEGWEEVERHTDIVKTIKWAKIDGCDDDVLDETDWQGPDMPVVQVLGEELHIFDKERRAEGMVRPMREPCQGNNAMISKFVEMVAMTPVPTLMMAAGQQEGFEEWYKAAVTRTLPYLLYNQKDVNENPAVQPFAPANRDMPIAPVATGLQMFNEAIQDSSISAPALGEVDGSVKSAKHASVLRDEAAQGTSNYLDNLKRSMEYEAQIVNNLLYPIYGKRPGRLARIVNGEGDASHVLIGQPMTLQGGRPTQAAPDAPGAKTYALTEHARFNTAVKISKNFDTRRQQEASALGELLGAAPDLMTVFGDLYFKNQDGPGHTEMSERMKVMLNPKVLELIESKKQGQEPPSPQLQQAQQQIQQLTQQLQQAGQMLQTEQVKEQAETQRASAETAAKVQIAQLDAQLKLQIAELDNRTKLQIEEWKLQNARMQAEMDAQQAALGAVAQRESEDAGRRHEAGMAAMGSVDADAGRQHASAEAQAAREAQAGDADAARQFEAEQAEMARVAAAEQAAQSEAGQA